MSKIEPLDYCRVKKISEKGFGFLTSLYYKESVFFHFNYVKNLEAKAKLEKLKRGEVYFYYTSKLRDGKRKVDKLWLNISDADQDLIPQFITRIIQELNFGRTNPFEVAHVIKELRSIKSITLQDFEKIIGTSKLLKIPSILKALLLEDESNKLDEIIELIEQYENQLINSDQWKSRVVKVIYN